MIGRRLFVYFVLGDNNSTCSKLIIAAARHFQKQSKEDAASAPELLQGDVAVGKLAQVSTIGDMRVEVATYCYTCFKSMFNTGICHKMKMLVMVTNLPINLHLLTLVATANLRFADMS